MTAPTTDSTRKPCCCHSAGGHRACLPQWNGRGRTRPQACQWTEHEGPCPTCRARRWESTAVLEAPLSSPGPAGCAHGRARSWADMRGQDRSGCGQGDKRGVRGPGLPQEGLCVCAPPCLPLSLPHALPKELPAPPPRGGTYRLPHPLGGGAYRLPLPPRGGAYYCPAHREVGPTAAPGSGPGPPPPRLGEDSAPAGALSPQVSPELPPAKAPWGSPTSRPAPTWLMCQAHGYGVRGASATI